jgi:hypothetical protein
MTTIELDALQRRFATVARALQPAEPAAVSPAAAPPLAVEVVRLPAPRHRWLFSIERDAEGRVASVLAEPLS